MYQTLSILAQIADPATQGRSLPVLGVHSVPVLGEKANGYDEGNPRTLLTGDLPFNAKIITDLYHALH